MLLLVLEAIPSPLIHFWIAVFLTLLAFAILIYTIMHSNRALRPRS